MSTTPRSELTYDGIGINGPDEYRTRVAKFDKQADADKYGPLFAAAPDLLAALQASCIALQDCERRLKSLEGEINYPKLDYQLAENYDLINKAKGSPA